MIKRYNSSAALGLGNMTPGMTKQQKDAVERATEAKIEKHFRSHRELPNGRNFRMWNRAKDNKADHAFRSNFDSIFPNSPGAGL